MPKITAISLEDRCASLSLEDGITRYVVATELLQLPFWITCDEAATAYKSFEEYCEHAEHSTSEDRDAAWQWWNMCAHEITTFEQGATLVREWYTGADDVQSEA